LHAALYARCLTSDGRQDALDCTLEGCAVLADRTCVRVPNALCHLVAGQGSAVTRDGHAIAELRRSGSGFSKVFSSAGHDQDGVPRRSNEGADVLRIAGSDPVPRVGDRDHRGIDGIASAGPSQKNPRNLASSTVHRPDVNRAD
jgi:hypothetical protein